MAKQRPHGSGTLYKRRGRGVYVMRWTDHNGKRREASSKTTDKTTAERLLSKRIADAALRRDGVVDASMDRVIQERSRPILDHLDDFEANMAARRGTAKHVKGTVSYIKLIIETTKAKTVDDLNPSSVQSTIAGLRKGALSVRARNAHLRAIKSFTRWLLRDGRIQADTLQHLKAGNADADRRYERRDLTPDELNLLIQAAEHGVDVTWRTGLARSSPTEHITGADRAMLYRIAAGTGFRRNEIASLTPESFSLDGSPTITIQAAYSKRRREDVQPIRDDLADVLRPWLAGKAKGETVFTLPEKTAKMMRTDLEAAGIAHTDDAGRKVDFHSLRHTYISRVVESGVSVKVAQELARHSTPTLTIGRYSHVRISDLSTALDGLPATDQPDIETDAMRATGTEDVRSGDAVDPRHMSRQLGCFSQQKTAKHSETDAPDIGHAENRNPLIVADVSDGVRRNATVVDNARPGNRTPNPLIKSQLLCQLS